MGAFSIWHLLIVLLIVMIFFGAGKLPGVMKDLGRGVKNFKDAFNNPDEATDDKPATPPVIEAKAEPQAKPADKPHA
ncbi:MAG: Sec-independent protein translocase subunit TatA [Magnetococcales bacterium]|nr:Sec-independent protein translocase subunit TatA [Magnetococcales bacterium]